MLVVLAATGALRSFFVSWGMVLGALTFLTIGGSWYAYVGAVVPGAPGVPWDNHVAGRLVSVSYHPTPADGRDRISAGPRRDLASQRRFGSL
jgi:hypothetical protein